MQMQIKQSKTQTKMLCKGGYQNAIQKEQKSNVTVSIESNQQVEVKAASNIELKFNSDIQTAKSVPTFCTSISLETSNYWGQYTVRKQRKKKSDLQELIPIVSVLNFNKTKVQIVWYLSEHFDNGDCWGILSLLCFGRYFIEHGIAIGVDMCIHILAPNILLRLTQSCKPIKS